MVIDGMMTVLVKIFEFLVFRGVSNLLKDMSSFHWYIITQNIAIFGACYNI